MKTVGSAKNLLIIFCLMAILGVSFSVQFQAQHSPERELYRQRQEDLIIMERDLRAKRLRLAQEMADLSNLLHDRRNAMADESLTIRSLEQQLVRLEILNGTSPVTGPGLNVIFSATADVIHSHVILLVNELWAAGAEAVAVGGHRLSANSNIFFSDMPDGRVITVNNIPVPLPLTVNAIGDTNTLERSLTMPGGFMDIMMFRRIYPTLRQIESMELPAVASPPMFHFQSIFHPTT